MLSMSTRPRMERASSPDGDACPGSSMRNTPSRCSPATRCADMSSICRATYTKSASRASRSVSAAGSPPRIGVSSAAARAGSAISRGSAQIVCFGTVSASSAPLRSKIVPRSAGSTTERTRCDSPSAVYRAAPTVWSVPTRTSTAPNASTLTISVHANRTAGRPTRRVVPRRACGRRCATSRVAPAEERVVPDRCVEVRAGPRVRVGDAGVTGPSP